MYLLLRGLDFLQVEIDSFQMSPDELLDRDQVAVWSQQNDAHASLLKEGPTLRTPMITCPIEAVYNLVHLVRVVLLDELMQVNHEDNENLGCGICLSAGVVDSTFGVYCTN